MNETEYRAAINSCCEAASVGDGSLWNKQFLAALDAFGLKLIPESMSLSKDFYIIAPLPYGHHEPRWDRSWIVEKEQ